MAKRSGGSGTVPGPQPGEAGPPKVGVIAGLLVELACLGAPDGAAVFAAAGDAERAAEAARRMITEDSAAALLSFGIAGGLDPALEPGDIVIPVTVFSPEGRGYPCHMPLVAALKALAPGAAGGALAGTDRVVRTRREKRDLYARTGASAVDMESHAVALVAEEHGVPFAALRVISDPASGVIPTAALAAMQPDGSLDQRAVLRRALGQPWQIPALVLLAIHSRKAFARLRALGAKDPVGATASAIRPRTRD